MGNNQSAAAGGGAPDQDKTPVQTPKTTRRTRCNHCRDGHRACDLKRPICTTCRELKQPMYCQWPDGQATANPAMAAASSSVATHNHPNEEDPPASSSTSSSSSSSSNSPSSEADPISEQEGEPLSSHQPSDPPGHQASDSTDSENDTDREATRSNNGSPRNMSAQQPHPSWSEQPGGYQDPAEAARALRELEQQEAETNETEPPQQAPRPQYPFLHADSHNVMFSNPLFPSDVLAEFGIDNPPAPVPQRPNDRTQGQRATPRHQFGFPLSTINFPTAADPSLQGFAGYPEALGMARPIQDAANPRPFVTTDDNGQFLAQLSWDAHQVYFLGQNLQVELPHEAFAGAIPSRAEEPNGRLAQNFAQGQYNNPYLPGAGLEQQAGLDFDMAFADVEMMDAESNGDDSIIAMRNLDQAIHDQVDAPNQPLPPVHLGANGQPELDLRWPQHNVYYPGQAQNSWFLLPDGTYSGALPPMQPGTRQAAHEPIQPQDQQETEPEVLGGDTQEGEEE